MATVGRLIRTMAIVLGVTLCWSVVAPAALAAPARRTKVRRIAPGVVYRLISTRRPAQKIRIVRIDPRYASTLDVALAQDKLRGFERTSSMARRHGAIVAINGDYGLPSGRPVHAFAQDGVVLQSALMWGRNFSYNRSETAFYVGHPRLRTWLDENPLVRHRVNRTNAGAPRSNEIGLFTPPGRRLEPLPSESCSARLYPQEEPRLTSDGWVTSSHQVDAVRCSDKPLARKGGTIASTPADGERTDEFSVPYLMVGKKVDLRWSLGWPGVFDTVGGNPTLIEQGRIVWSNVTGTHWFFRRHPRTAVGVTSRGHILFVTIDGRQRRAKGMTLRALARFLRRRGVQWALNLDGGGSTTMVVKGKVRNRPSDGSERAVSSALLLLPAGDPGEEEASSTILSFSGEPGAASESVHDPASTGGLLSSLEQAGLRIPARLRSTARTFERSR